MYSAIAFDKSSKISEINEALLGINSDVTSIIVSANEEGELISPKSLSQSSKICSFKTFRKLLYSLEEVPSCRNSILFVARLVYLQQQACFLEEHNISETDSRKIKNKKFKSHEVKVVCEAVEYLLGNAHHPAEWVSVLVKWCIHLLQELESIFPFDDIIKADKPNQPQLDQRLGIRMSQQPVVSLYNILLLCIAKLASSQHNHLSLDLTNIQSHYSSLDVTHEPPTEYQSLVLWIIKYVRISGKPQLDWLIAALSFHHTELITLYTITAFFTPTTLNSFLASFKKVGRGASDGVLASVFGVPFEAALVEFLGQHFTAKLVTQAKQYWTQAFKSNQGFPLIGFLTLLTICPNLFQAFIPFVLNQVSTVAQISAIYKLAAGCLSRQDLVEWISFIISRRVSNFEGQSFRLLSLLERLSTPNTSMDVDLHIDPSVIQNVATEIKARAIQTLSEGVLQLLFPTKPGLVSSTQMFLSTTADKIPDMLHLISEHPSGEPIFQYVLELLGVSVSKDTATQVLCHVFHKAIDKPAFLQLFWDYAGIFDQSFPGCFQACLHKLVHEINYLTPQQLCSFATLMSSLVDTDSLHQRPLGIREMLSREWLALFSMLYAPRLPTEGYYPASQVSTRFSELLLKIPSGNLTDNSGKSHCIAVNKAFRYLISLLVTFTSMTKTQAEDDCSPSLQNVSLQFHLQKDLELAKALVAKVGCENEDTLSELTATLLDFIFGGSADTTVRTPISNPLLLIPPTDSVISPPPLHLAPIPIHYAPQTSSVTPVDTSTDSTAITVPRYLNLLEQNRKRSIHATPIGTTKQLRILDLRQPSPSKKSKLWHTTTEASVELDALRIHSNRLILKDLLYRCYELSKQDNQDSVFAQTLTSSFLWKVVPVLEPVPTYEQYNEVLPRRAAFPRDEHILKVFKQNPFLFDVLDIIALDPRELIRCLEVMKSLLAIQIGSWYAESQITKGGSTSSQHFDPTMRLVTILKQAQWIPQPLSDCMELFDQITAKDIWALLLIFWNYMKDNPPSVASYQLQVDGSLRAWKRTFSPTKLDAYLLPVRSVIRNHIENLAPYYSRFIT